MAYVRSADGSRVRGMAAGGLVLAATLIATLAPSAAGATPTTGVWIFPSLHRTAALADDLADTFYTTDAENLWIFNSYFGDATADAADVSVDLFNPTSANLYNVQVFAAINDISLLSDISFEGGDSGDVSYAAADIGGGTPFLADGSTLDDHDVYPAFFVSYGVGDLDAGSSNLRSIQVVVNGDFASGLIVHLDYSAEDAAGSPVTGPFEADMNIFEAGEFEEPPCTPAEFSLTAKASNDRPAPGSAITLEWLFMQTAGDTPSNVDLAVVVPNGATTGEVSVSVGASVSTPNPSFVVSTSGDGGGTGGATVKATLKLSDLLLPGALLNIAATLSWDSCEGESGSTGATTTLTLSRAASGNVHTAAWWADEFKDAKRGKGKLTFSTDELTLFLQRAALASDVFTYGEWDGTAPTGDEDHGWLNIGSFDDAREVLRGHSDDSKKVRGAEKQVLALWLNVAAGALNLETALEIEATKKGQSEFEEHTGLGTLSSSYDTVIEVLAFAETQIDDWQDGAGSSKADLKLARKLAKAINHEWLVPA